MSEKTNSDQVPDDVPDENMCANCKHRGKTFQSAYSGNTMIVCKLTGKSRLDYQGCDDWEHYKKVTDQ